MALTVPQAICLLITRDAQLVAVIRQMPAEDQEREVKVALERRFQGSKPDALGNSLDLLIEVLNRYSPARDYKQMADELYASAELMLEAILRREHIGLLARRLPRSPLEIIEPAEMTGLKLRGIHAGRSGSTVLWDLCVNEEALITAAWHKAAPEIAPSTMPPAHADPAADPPVRRRRGPKPKKTNEVVAAIRQRMDAGSLTLNELRAMTEDTLMAMFKEFNYSRTTFRTAKDSVLNCT
jgi:hypothetical protein